MIHSLAVTTDFSALSREAFQVAADIARRFNARLELVHVDESETVVTAWQVVSSSEEQQETRLNELRTHLEKLTCTETAFSGVTVRPRVLRGGSAEAIQRFEKHEAIDLVVIASHGGVGTDHFSLGSFTAKVLELVSCPVLVLNASCRDGRGTSGSFRPSRVLVPHDFSHESGVAIDEASWWATQFQASARFLFVVDEHASSYGYLAGRYDSVSSYFDRVRSEGLEKLSALADKSSASAEAVARIGKPAEEILREAERFDADLIVMARHGRSLAERLRLGSVTERVVHSAVCPVLVLRGEPTRLLT